MKNIKTLLASSAVVLGLAGGVVAVSADNVPAFTAQNINQRSTGQQNVPANEAQTINSARAYLMNTIINDDSQHMTGDLPTQAQNGPSNWSVSKQTGNSATIACNGTPLFTLTNNGNGTSNLDYCNWHFVVRNSDHKILGNVGEASVPSTQNNNQKAVQNNTQVAKTQQAAPATQQNGDNKAATRNNNAQTADNTASVQNNTTAAQTQASNNVAANETTTKNGGVFMKDNAKSLPQTGENGSEIMTIAGGMIIAMTAAGVVVYKKRN